MRLRLPLACQVLVSARCPDWLTRRVAQNMPPPQHREVMTALVQHPKFCLISFVATRHRRIKSTQHSCPVVRVNKF